MSYLEIDHARAHHAELVAEVQNIHRARQAAAARRSLRKAARLSSKAERVSRRAEQAATQARAAVASVF